MLSPESLADPGLDFDEAALLASYELELDINFEEQAQAALSDILAAQSDDNHTKTYEEIKTETEAFFANPWVAEDMRLLDSLALQYAQNCMSHGHGMEEGMLGAIYSRGASQMDDGHGHHHAAHASPEKDEEKSGSAKKRKKVASYVTLSDRIMQLTRPTPTESKKSYGLAA